FLRHEGIPDCRTTYGPHAELHQQTVFFPGEAIGLCLHVPVAGGGHQQRGAVLSLELRVGAARYQRAHGFGAIGFGGHQQGRLFSGDLPEQAATAAAPPAGGSLRRTRVGVGALGQQFLHQFHVARLRGGVQRCIAPAMATFGLVPPPASAPAASVLLCDAATSRFSVPSGSAKLASAPAASKSRTDFASLRMAANTSAVKPLFEAAWISALCSIRTCTTSGC